MEKNENTLLKKYRDQIDFFDNEIVNLIYERFEIVKLVWEYKKKHNIKPLDESRWKKVIEKVTNKAEELWVNPMLIYNIWEMMHEEALRVEKER